MGHYNDGQLSRQWDGSSCILACSAHFSKPIQHIDCVLEFHGFHCGGGGGGGNTQANVYKSYK